MRKYSTAAALLATLALVACGGGGPDSQDTPVSASDPEAPVGDSLPSTDVVAQPQFHMLPVVAPTPSTIDMDGTEASAKLGPAEVHVPYELKSLDTARLTVQEVAEAEVAAAALPLGVQPLAATLPSTVFTPAQVRAAYRLPPIAGATPASLGSGQTIYVVVAYAGLQTQRDLNSFSLAFGLPACASAPISPSAKLPLPPPAKGAGCTLSIVYSKAADLGMTATAPAYNAVWASEAALDVQSAHAIAPMARIILLEAPTNNTSSLVQAVRLANAMGPGVVSMSWGSPEAKLAATFTQYESSFSGSGMSYVSSTGDAGAGVSWPSSSSKVLAVGGTSLAYNGSGVRTEYVWSGTGGGISAYVGLPSYQAGVTVARSGLLKKRGVADVSFNADPQTGQYVMLTETASGTANYRVFGGTSLSAPQWAGVLALAGAVRSVTKSTMSTVGDTHKALYLVPSNPAGAAGSFGDITTGSHGTCVICVAAPGYDLPTGLGTPNLEKMVAYLAR